MSLEDESIVTTKSIVDFIRGMALREMMRLLTRVDHCDICNTKCYTDRQNRKFSIKKLAEYHLAGHVEI